MIVLIDTRIHVPESPLAGIPGSLRRRPFRLKLNVPQIGVLARVFGNPVDFVLKIFGYKSGRFKHSI